MSDLAVSRLFKLVALPIRTQNGHRPVLGRRVPQKGLLKRTFSTCLTELTEELGRCSDLEEGIHSISSTVGVLVSEWGVKNEPLNQFRALLDHSIKNQRFEVTEAFLKCLDELRCDPVLGDVFHTFWKILDLTYPKSGPIRLKPVSKPYEQTLASFSRTYGKSSILRKKMKSLVAFQRLISDSLMYTPNTIERKLLTQVAEILGQAVNLKKADSFSKLTAYANTFLKVLERNRSFSKSLADPIIHYILGKMNELIQHHTHFIFKATKNIQECQNKGVKTSISWIKKIISHYKVSGETKKDLLLLCTLIKDPKRRQSLINPDQNREFGQVRDLIRVACLRNHILLGGLVDEVLKNLTQLNITQNNIDNPIRN